MAGVIISSEREIPRFDLGEYIATLADKSAAERMTAYLEKNWDRFRSIMPTVSEDYLKEGNWALKFDAARREFLAGESLKLLIFCGDEQGEIIGDLSYTNFVRGPLQACYLGFKLDNAYERQGIMYRSLEASISFVFDEMKLHRIMANYIPSNERSGNLLRRLNFTIEGYARDYLKLDGVWRDHILTSIVNSRWTPL